MHQRPRRPGARLLAVLALLAVAGSGCTAARQPEPADRGQAQPSKPYSGPAVAGKAIPLGAKWDWPRLERYTPYLKSLAGGATFHELVWCMVEPRPGQQNWNAVDQVVDSSRRLGHQLYLKIRVGSCWATGGRGGHVRGTRRKTASAMPEDLAAYRAFVGEAVRRYAAKGVHEYAIENEPNAANFWAGTPEELERLATEAASAIREADPKALVVDPGVSSTAYGVAIAKRLLDQGRADEAVAAYQRYYVRRFPVRGRKLPQAHDEAGLRAALDTEQARVNLAFLQLADRLAAGRVVDVRQLHFYEPWDNVPALLDYLRATLPPRFPVQAWEVGMFWVGGSDDPQARAGEVVKTVASLLAGGVRPVIWLPLAFDPSGRHADEPRYGLLEPDGTVRPAGVAFAKIAAAAHDARVVALPDGPVAGVAFGAGSATTLLVWSDGPQTIAKPKSGNASAERAEGGAVPWDGGKLTVTTQPVLISTQLPVDQALALLPRQGTHPSPRVTS